MALRSFPMANTKRAREFLEAWYSSAGSVNRHVDLDAHYEGLRSRLAAPSPNATSTAANPAIRISIDPPSILPLQHRDPNCETSIENSTEFLKKAKGITVSSDEIMVSFDVVSLVMSIPLDLAKQCTEDRLKSCDTDVPAIALLELLDLCMETNFSFDQQYYQQLKGAPMGSPISGFLAEITMQKLEATALPLVNPNLWLRYVDDTFVIVKKDQLETLHNTINSTMPGIQFTLEEGVDKELPFLDVLVQRKTDGTLRTSVYRKETYADVILHYESNHPISHKRSAVNSLLNRAKTHCSDEEGYRAELSFSPALFDKIPRVAVRCEEFPQELDLSLFVGCLGAMGFYTPVVFSRSCVCAKEGGC
ncbi:hypothetical protein SprV_0401523500 [Sparganum proliferum]